MGEGVGEVEGEVKEEQRKGEGKAKEGHNGLKRPGRGIVKGLVEG